MLVCRPGRRGGLDPAGRCWSPWPPPRRGRSCGPHLLFVIPPMSPHSFAVGRFALFSSTCVLSCCGSPVQALWRPDPPGSALKISGHHRWGSDPDLPGSARICPDPPGVFLRPARIHIPERTMFPRDIPRFASPISTYQARFDTL